MLQVVIPMFNEPLLTELWLHNYVQYKQKHVDRLILVVTTRFIEYNDPVTADLTRLENTLKKLNVTNYKIVPVAGCGMHGLIFSEVLNEIYDSQYHTLIDEQDAYWLHDDFGEFVKLLDTYDIIGGEKRSYPQKFDMELFNAKFGTKHQKKLQFLHLPQFLSNRIVTKIKDFRGECREIPTKECGLEDVTTETSMLFDTFQYINLQAYKNTDKVLLYPDGEKLHPGVEDINVDCAWNITNTILYQNLRTVPNTTFDENVLFHTGGTIHFSRAFLYNNKSAKNLINDYVNPLYTYLNERAILNMNFHYQSLAYLPDFPHKQNYVENFKKIKTQVNLNKYDCSVILNKILNKLD
jgi:chloramphenicol O-acetyltransferase